MPAGYSKTPLLKKLGIKEGYKIRLVNPPIHYMELLGSVPDKVEFLNNAKTLANFVHLFSLDIAHFEAHFPKLTETIEKNGMIWVSWYKKASKIPTDMSEDVIRNTALSMGLVDVKVCAVDEQWSALKIVWRKENR